MTTRQTWLRISILIAIISVFALPIFAQDDTSAPSTDPTAVTLGPLTIEATAPWQLTEGSGGVIALTNFDVQQASALGAFPQDGVIAQMRFVGIPRINLGDEEVNARNILGGILLSQGETEETIPRISEVVFDNYTFARANVTQEGGATAFLYTAVLTDTTFAIITAASQEGLTLEREEGMLEILDTMALSFDAPIPEGATDRYQQYTIGVSEAGFPRLGDPDAPVTVVEISSFDCPACGIFHDTVLPTLLERVIAGEVRFVYIPVFGTGSIPNGDSAARAALCVGNENFWAFHDAIFSWQQEFGSFAFAYERLQSAAAAFDIDATEFDSCFIDERTTQVLESAIRVVREQTPDSFATPTVIVNNQRVDVSVITINDAIDAALESAATETTGE